MIGLNLCPFAKSPFEDGKINIKTSSEGGLPNVFQEQLQAINEGKFQTSLIVLDSDLDFETFFGLTQDYEYLLEQSELNSVFQLVAFHPGFQFDGADSEDRANLVNRSPYPTLHILRFSDIEDLNLSPEEAKEISLRNEGKLLEMSETSLKNFFPGRFS